ncbi:MAG TPA: c-type cytochrome [Nitrospira sp.]|jgi:mono/diheme cytochrome c family protein|nr:c-type cytochrome [Nitrospira sp.]
MRNPINNVWWRGIRLVLFLGMLVACESGATNPEGGKSTSNSTPADVQLGETKFSASCAACHGVRGVGTKQGPPLVHKIYEPNHHADIAFHRAVENGVRAHHWEFGNMPKIDGVTSSDADHIIRYVRWLQREAGIY